MSRRIKWDNIVLVCWVLCVVLDLANATLWFFVFDHDHWLGALWAFLALVYVWLIVFDTKRVKRRESNR